MKSIWKSDIFSITSDGTHVCATYFPNATFFDKVNAAFVMYSTGNAKRNSASFVEAVSVLAFKVLTSVISFAPTAFFTSE